MNRNRLSAPWGVSTSVSLAVAPSGVFASFCKAARGQFLANAEADPRPEPQLFVNVSLAIDEKGWVQLAPYGDFRNVDGAGKPVIQRFQKTDAENIVNEFTSNATLPQRLLGLPWYVGHPDHPRFAGKPGHTDSKAYGRIKKLEARDDGLYANVKFGGAGKSLIEDEAFHGHSVNWLALPSGHENGTQIFRPVLLKSVGFTNQPQIPARPASLANDGAEESYSFEALPNDTTDMIIPPKLKLIAGFKADEDVTMEQILAALEKMQTSQLAQAGTMANEKEKNMEKDKPVDLTIGDKKYSVVLANEESGDLLSAVTKLATDEKKAGEDLANEKKARGEERKARATLVVDPLVEKGKIVLADRDAKITELCNAEDFDAKAKEFANFAVVVKTKAKTGDLNGKHAVMTDNDGATRKFEALMSSRAAEFPNETYQDRFAAVCNSDQGEQLIGQMKRAGSEE